MPNIHRQLNRLLRHIEKVEATHIEDLDMIGSAVQYEELSPNWRTVLNSLELNPVEHYHEAINTDRANKYTTYALRYNDGKPIGFVPHDRGRYDSYNKDKLLEQLLWFALSKNRKLDPYAVSFKPLHKQFGKGEAYHPLYLLLELLERPTDISLVSTWYEDEDRDLLFPTHRIVLQ